MLVIVNYLVMPLIDRMFGALFSLVFRVTAIIQKSILGGIVVTFRPDINEFRARVGSTAILTVTFDTLAGVLLGGLFLFYLVAHLFNAIRLAEVKDTVPQLIGRAAIGAVFIYSAKDITDWLFGVVDNVWDIVMGIPYTLDEIDYVESAVRTSANILGVEAAAVTDVAMQIALMFISLVLLIALTIQFLKLAIEIIERYVVACILYFAFPLAAATVVSKNTAPVFKRYIQMLLTSLLMLLMNLVFVRIILSATHTLGQGSSGISIISWLFLFALLRAAQKIDNYVQSLGLSVAVTGGSLLDSIGIAAAGVMKAAKGFTGGAGNVMAQVGARTGNAGLLAAGNNIMGLANLSRGGTPFMTKAGAMNMMAKNHASGMAKGLSKVSPKDLSGEHVNIFKSGGQAAQVFNAMNGDAKKKLFGMAGYDALLPSGANVSSLVQDRRNGAISGLMHLKDANGNDISRAFTITPDARGGGLRGMDCTDINGNSQGMFLNVSEKAMPGVEMNLGTDGEGAQAASVVFGTDLEKKFGAESIAAADRAIAGTDGEIMLVQDDADGGPAAVARMDAKGNVHTQGTKLAAGDIEAKPFMAGHKDIAFAAPENGRNVFFSTAADGTKHKYEAVGNAGNGTSTGKYVGSVGVNDSGAHSANIYHLGTANANEYNKATHDGKILNKEVRVMAPSRPGTSAASTTSSSTVAPARPGTVPAANNLSTSKRTPKPPITGKQSS